MLPPDCKDAPRLACVDIPTLSLQLLAHRFTDFADHPAVVISEDRPQGIVLAANRQARTARILPGMRYAAALALAADLRAGVVPDNEVQVAVADLAEHLRRFSPEVEPSREELGVFWLDVRGLLGLFGTMTEWATGLRESLRAVGFYAAVAVGFRRFSLYAIARYFRGLRVCGEVEQEAMLADRVDLAALGPLLGLEPRVRDAMHLLGIRTMGAFLQLPAEGLRERHGEATLRLHRLATGERSQPLRPEHPQPPPAAQCDVEPPDDHSERLLFLAKGLLVKLLRDVAAQRQVVASLVLRLELEQPGGDVLRDTKIKHTPPPVLEELLQPAEPCLHEVQLVDLIRLRLEQLQLPAPCTRLHLCLRTVPAAVAQLRLWQLSGRRDREAARLALARLRAAYGERSVVHAKLRSNHLTEAQFSWEPLNALPEPAPPPKQPVRLVRRMHPKPVPLPSRPSREPDGWLLADWRQGAVLRQWGPFRVTGGWWQREVRRDYYYLEAERGDILFVYHDAVRRQWFLAGVVD